MGRAVDILDGVSSVFLVTHACIYDIVVLHNVFMQLVGTEVCDAQEMPGTEVCDAHKLPVLFSKMYLCNKMYF